ncbi:MAG: hypothetical protein K0U74_17400 [Alphaproteobacteria bacterium]|nr:hypothetical protein [Alphaproteobacteria bacterium]
MADKKSDEVNRDEKEPLPTPSQGGRSGGELARDVGTRDSLERAQTGKQGVTRVRRSDELQDDDR